MKWRMSLIQGMQWREVLRAHVRDVRSRALTLTIDESVAENRGVSSPDTLVFNTEDVLEVRLGLVG
jgi:hypothetical protein